MGGVAYAEEAGAVPAFETVDLDGEEFDLVPIGDLVYAVGKKGTRRAIQARKAGRPAGWIVVVKLSLAMRKAHWK